MRIWPFGSAEPRAGRGDAQDAPAEVGQIETDDAAHGYSGARWIAAAAALTSEERAELSRLTPSFEGHNFTASWSGTRLRWEEDFFGQPGRRGRIGPRAILPVEAARAAHADRIRKAKGMIVTTRGEWAIVAPHWPEASNGCSVERDGQKWTLEIPREVVEQELAAKVADYEAWRDRWHWPAEARWDPRWPRSGSRVGGGEKDARRLASRRFAMMQIAVTHEPWRDGEIALVIGHTRVGLWSHDEYEPPAGILYREDGVLCRVATSEAPRAVAAITRAEWNERGFPATRRSAGLAPRAWGGKGSLTWTTVETKDGALYRLADGEDASIVEESAP